MGENLNNNHNNFLINFNLKHLYITFDELIIDSLNYGNMHFFITINFLKEIKNKSKIEKEINNLEKILIDVDLWSWHIIVSEKNKNENYHLHLILSVRSCIGYNDIIENNILFFLRNNFEVDTKINFCLKFIDIKKTLKYLFKDLEKKNNSQILNEIKTNKIIKISILSKQKNIFKYLSKFFEMTYYKYEEKLEKNELIENCIKNSMIVKKNEEKIIYKTNSDFFNNFMGIKIEKKEYSEKQTIFIWNLFLILNDLFLYKRGVYKKLKNFNISYELIIQDEYLYTNFITIIDYLKKKLYFQFNNFDNSNYYSNFLKNKEEKLERLKNYTNNFLQPNFYLMEFTDGVYKILENKFIKNENIYNSNIIKSQTIKYYNFTYKHLSLPTVWLNGVKNVLNIKIENNLISKIIHNIINLENNKNNLNNLIDLLIYIAYVFHFSSNILNKKNTIYIWGPSNTGKTTLIIDLFINYFGKENVGLLSNNKNFTYQDIIDKLILILDEFDMSTIKTEDFKKIISKELILGEKKNKEPQLIKPTPLIISSNKNIINEQYLENKESIINRLKIIHFKTPISEKNMDFNIKEKIKNEEAKIIILCNKMYFNFLKNKEEKLENIKYIIEEEFNK